MSRQITENELLSVLRDRSASTAEFRSASDSLARLISARALSKLHGNSSTRLSSAACGTEQDNILILPVMRAGLAIVPAFTELVSGAPVGIVGIERDEKTAEPSLYYEKLPEVLPETAVIVDPMLATGGSACLVVDLLNGRGYEPAEIYFVGVLAAPEGIAKLTQLIPRANIVVSAVDQGLDDRNFIVPGLGDYGDRYYGTA